MLLRVREKMDEADLKLLSSQLASFSLALTSGRKKINKKNILPRLKVSNLNLRFLKKGSG